MQKKHFDLKTITNHPGVYCFLNADQEILYVGKAKNLRKRLSSYFSGTQSLKTQSLLRNCVDLQITVTLSEKEALLLEYSLIKKHHPRFNILLRDDKSYPYLLLSKDAFPRLSYYRGNKNANGTYFGPYPSIHAVKNSLNLVQTLFRLRSCDNVFYKQRTRPCLQYQLERCTAPCVGFIKQEEYSKAVTLASHFLKGENTLVLDALIERMNLAASALNFEEASTYRDLISDLRQIQEKQTILGEHGELDILGFDLDPFMICIHLLYVRQGKMVGSRSFLLKIPADEELDTILGNFLLQYYSVNQNDWPKQIILTENLKNSSIISEILSERAARKIRISSEPKGLAKDWVQMAVLSAKQALEKRISQESFFKKRLSALAKALKLKNLSHLECFDVSHTQGNETFAACVVFKERGPSKSDYRLFSLKATKASDDYGGLREAIERHYKRIVKENSPIPHLLLIDGGKGQLRVAAEVLAGLDLSIPLFAMSKGPARRMGNEILYCWHESQALVVELSSESPAFHLLQQLRDEAHRFSLKAHRAARAKKHQSKVVQIAGVGDTKHRLLLTYFGGLSALKSASIAEIRKVPGIGQSLAARIYAALHEAEH
jgi:excinuclease ABC subunit C